MISGAFAAVYFVPYGAWGLVLPLIAMGAASVIVAFGINGARIAGIFEYSGYAGFLYGKAAKILSPLLELYIVAAMIVGGSAVIAMGGIFFNGLFGIGEFAGALLMAAISTVPVLWGDSLVRRASVFMTLVLIANFVVLVFYGIWERREDLGRILFQWETPEGIGFFSGLSGAFFLGLSNAPNGITLCSVSQKLEDQSDSISAGIISFIINSLCFIGSTALILPFAPSIPGEAVPNLFIINNYLSAKFPLLPALYSVVMLFGLVSSGVPQLHAVTSRALKLYPPNSLMNSKLLKNLFTSIIYMALCILISFLGLRVIIGRGYGLLGQMAIPLIIIPVCIILPLRIHQKTKGSRSRPR
jgi:uncharacterized membrane protein YkvI